MQIEEQPATPIDWDKPIETTGGLPARLLSKTVMFVQIEYPDGSVARTFYENGISCLPYEGKIRNRKVKREGWVNVYSATSSSYPYCKTVFPAEDQAQKEGVKHPSYITTIKIEWEE